MKKQSLIILALGILMLPILSCCKEEKTQTYYPKGKGTFRIMSYNVGAMHKFIPELVDNVDMIAAMIRETQPDIVALNELDSCNQRHNVNEVALLTEAVGKWKWYFGKAIDYRGGSYGNGIIVPEKTKVLNQYSHRFPNPTLEEENPRETRAVIVVETDRYVLLATHLGVGTYTLPDQTKANYMLLQIDDLNKLALEKYKDSPVPVFLCGDMNATPGSEAIRALEQYWEVISNQEEMTTVNSHRTIDFIFHLKDSAPVEVVGAHTLLKYYNGDSEKASDHFPIYADVKF